MLSILFQDESLLACEKPAGMRSVPGRGVEKQCCLQRELEGTFGPLGVVHRLDEATSGVIVFARTPEALRALSRQFAERTVQKEYVAIVAGPFPYQAGAIEGPLRRFSTDPPRYGIDWRQGKPARTEFEPLVHGEGWTRLRLRPITGRSHQLRAHLASLGTPILGDPIYGPQPPSPSDAPALEDVGFPRPSSESPAHTGSMPSPSEKIAAGRPGRPGSPGRLFLHAERLELVHPVAGSRLVLVSPAPF